MDGGRIANYTGENGGAVYVGDKGTFTMTDGLISSCTATNGGAVFIASGGTFEFFGGTIENCVAELGYAIYVQSGGTLDMTDSTGVFTGCGEDEDLHIYCEDGAILKGFGTKLNIYVDYVEGNEPTETIIVAQDYYTINEDDMPLSYEECCGYFYDEELSMCTSGVVDMTTANDAVTFMPKLLTEVVEEEQCVNIYTRTASDPSNFKFTYNSSTESYDIKASSTSISGDIVLPKEYDSIKTTLYNASQYYYGAFYDCEAITSITFQDGLKEIPIGSFCDCSGLTGCLIIPDSVIHINVCAFANCSGLTGSLIIPNGVTRINAQAFGSCSGFTGDLIIPNSVIYIGASAFEFCDGFAGELSLSNNLETIGSMAFYSCTGLTGQLFIPSSVAYIGDGAFSRCNFTGIQVDENNEEYEDKEKNVIVSTSPYITKHLVQGCNYSDLSVLSEVESIGGYAFSHCQLLTGDLVIPDNIISMGRSTFECCSGFTGNLVLSNKITEIKESVFRSCSGFTGSLTIPNTVTELGWYAFQNCYGFNGNLTLSNSLTSIGQGVFFDCSKLTGSLKIPEGVVQIKPGAFRGCSGLNGTLTLPSSLKYIDSQAFHGCSSLTGDLVIPDSVTTLAEESFMATGFTSVVISSAITVINDELFLNSVNLQSVTMRGAITKIGDEAFGQCYALKKLNSNATQDFNLPSTLVEIGHFAFRSCKSIKSITIPANVTAIGTADSAVFYDTNLSKVVVESLASFLQIQFTDNIYANPLYEGQNLYTRGAYNASTKLYNDTLLTEADLSSSAIEEISKRALYNYLSIARITLPNTLTKIGAEAFRLCKNLESIIIPATVSEIGERAFESAFTNKTGQTVSFGKNSQLKTIEFATFYNCSTLINVDLKYCTSLTEIKTQSFVGTLGLTEIYIPASVKVIGTDRFNKDKDGNSTGSHVSTFYNTNINKIIVGDVDAFFMIEFGNNYSNPMRACVSNSNPAVAKTMWRGHLYNVGTESEDYWEEELKQIELSVTVTKLDNYIMYCNKSLEAIILPNTITSIGNYAFNECTNLTTISIPNSVMHVGYQCFGSSGLNTATFEDGGDVWYGYENNKLTAEKEKTFTTSADGLETTSNRVMFRSNGAYAWYKERQIEEA